MSPQNPTESEIYELSEEGHLVSPSSTKANQKRVLYAEGSSIDWIQEDQAERNRQHALKSQYGLRGLMLPLLDGARMSFVVVATGIGIGIAGAWLDVLVKWLGDLREGRCTYGFFYNHVACCSGLEPGEICTEWKTWSEVLNVQFIFATSLLQALVYVSLAVVFASCASFLVTTYAPYAFHTGIPEIKAILGGYVFDAFLGPWTLLIKAIGLALSVASGLSLGKEGPLVHVSCCMAYLLSRLFQQFRESEAQKRKVLAAAAAAGVSVAFGSPLGGVLFGLEELDTFASETDVMWRGFVASAIAAVSLQWVNPFGTNKLVLFQVSNVADTWRTFELVPWLLLSVLGGVLGSLLIRLNVRVALFRRNSILHDWPVLEVVGVSAVTAAACYLIVFARVQTSELVANLFQECDKQYDYHGLCNPNAMWANVFVLVLTAALKLALTAWTFGMMIPAGIFLPTIAIGACLGRAVGLLTQGLQRAHPNAWMFLSCPGDPTIPCVSPGFYSVIGAAAMLGGVTRMTVSVVVILFELTGALSHVLPIMLSVMTAKWVGDALGKDGIYAVWIALRDYPWLPPTDYRDKGETAEMLMRNKDRLVVIKEGEYDVKDLDTLIKKYDFQGFPILRGDDLLGFITRERLASALHDLMSDTSSTTKKCTFSPPNSPTRPGSSESDSQSESVDLSDCLEPSLLQLRKEVPQELVVSMFQRLNLRRMLFTQSGKLTGMVTKRDVVRLLTGHFEPGAALSSRPI